MPITTPMPAKSAHARRKTFFKYKTSRERASLVSFSLGFHRLGGVVCLLGLCVPFDFLFLDRGLMRFVPNLDCCSNCTRYVDGKPLWFCRHANKNYKTHNDGVLW